MTEAVENDRPVLTYCRLGKDRTGLMTTLVLSTCGASEDEIVSDYARCAAATRALPLWVSVTDVDEGFPLQDVIPESSGRTAFLGCRFRLFRVSTRMSFLAPQGLPAPQGSTIVRIL